MTEVNKYVRREAHLLAKREHVLGPLAEAKYLSKINANCVSWQFKLAEESQHLMTVLTLFEKFKSRSLPFSITSAPEFFQKKMTQFFEGLPGVLCGLDDVVIYRSTPEEHHNTLLNVLQRLQDWGTILNMEKCKTSVKQVKFLGTFIAQGLCLGR